MSYRLEKTKDGESIVIDGWENGIASSPYLGTGNIRNLSTSYYPGVAYVNYRRRLATLSDGNFYAGAHSIDVSGNTGWIFTSSGTQLMGNPIGKAVSPLGLIYIQDDQGNIFKQSAVHSSTFNLLQNGGGRITDGAGGIAYWNNYLWVFGNGVIEVCGDGTGDAGIISTNWNLNNSSGFAKNGFTFVTGFGIDPTTLFVSFPYQYFYTTPRLKVGDAVMFTTTGTLPSPLVVGTTYFVARVTLTNQLTLSTSYLNANRTTTTLTASGATSANLSYAWGGTTGTYNVVFADGTVKSTTLTNGSTAFSWSGGLGSTQTSKLLIVAVTLTSDGTGTQTITSSSTVLPLGNSTGVVLNFSGSYPYTTLDFSDVGSPGSPGSYVSPIGTSITGYWKEATGIYDIVMENGQKVPANFTNGSSSVNLLSSLSYIQLGNLWTIQLLDPTVTNYRPYVSKVDGSLLFCNGQFIGRISLNSDPNVAFNPSLPSTYYVNFGVTSIPEQFTDTVTDMTDLRSNLVVAGKSDTYTWDYVSASCSSPAPVGEEIKGLVNILSNVYVLAGEKGNIYGSNGYSNQLLYKLPDFIAGIIDPVWQWGDVMLHRSKFFFQALAKTVTGTNILAGIFSLNVSPTAIGDSAKGLVMEAQNSYGLTPASGALRNGLLISDNPSANGNDSYFSAWSNGATTGGIDYNDTTLWQNFEPVVETDLIPIASVLQVKTLGNLEFKLDRPMVSGDQIRLSWRGNATDAYTLVGTFTSALISDYKQSDIAKQQWVQFKAEFKCAASGSSFIPLREIRVHLA